MAGSSGRQRVIHLLVTIAWPVSRRVHDMSFVIGRRPGESLLELANQQQQQQRAGVPFQKAKLDEEVCDYRTYISPCLSLSVE